MDNSKSKLKITLIGDGAEEMFRKLITRHFLPEAPLSIVFDTVTPNIEIMTAIMLFHTLIHPATIVIGKSKIETVDKNAPVYTIKTIDIYKDILNLPNDKRTIVCSEIIKEEDLFLAAPDIYVGIGSNPEYCSALQAALYHRFTALDGGDTKYPGHYYAIIASSSGGDIMLARLIL